jgi:GT2 family glycosyltransferase
MNNNNNNTETAIIIANWNGKKFLKDCLDSLNKQTYNNFEIILIDNGSSDGSVEFINKNYPKIKIIKLNKNTGFAYPNNLGIKEAFKNKNVKYIITLNNDIKADKNYLKALIKEVKSNSSVGSLQPKVINFFDKDIIDCTGILIYKDCSAINRGQKEKDIGQFEKKEEVFGPSASAALYTKEALEKTKLPNGDYFDSDYFAYYEDVDLAWRMRLAGFSSLFIPEAKIFHVHSATGKSYSPFKSFHIHRNQYYNIIKNMPGMFLWRALLFMPIRYIYLLLSIVRKKGPSVNLKKNAVKEKTSLIKIVLKSWKDIILNLPINLKKRKYIQGNKKISNNEISKLLNQYSANIEDMIYR